MEITAKRHDKDCYQLREENGTVVAFALRLTNGLWGLFDTNDKPLSKAYFDKPERVRQLMQERVDGRGS